MITHDGKLHIFETFQLDRTLPKFRSDRRDGQGRRVQMKRGQFSRNEESLDESDGTTILVGTGPMMISPLQSWWRKALRFLTPKAPPAPEPRLTVEEFFASVKDSAQEAQIIQERLAGYKAVLLSARKNGQSALVEQLLADIEAVGAETRLVALGLPKYLREEDIVRFVKESPKGLRLDYVQNFMRLIPAEVANTKARCDESGIFDNYVVLHYDPEGKSWAQTEAEREAERRRKADPILFGLIRGRRRLYFVGDWIDNTCDLTLEQVADALGVGLTGVPEIPVEYDIGEAT